MDKTDTRLDTLCLRPDGTIDCEFYIQRSRKRRAELLQSAPEPARRSPASRAKRHGRMFLAALAMATGMSWVMMLSSPPVTQAEASSNFSVLELHRNAAQNLPTLEPDAI